MRFEGKVYVVTGTYQGIGLAVCERLLSEGASVGMLDIRRQDALDPQDRSLAVTADVSDSSALAAAIGEVAEHFGRLDGLVNNAGINGPYATAEDYDEDVFDKIVAVNLKAVWIATRAVIPHLREAGGGAIVNIGSTSAFVGYAGRMPYTATKHAVLGMTKAVAAEVAEDNIRVNCVCPSGVSTPMILDAELGRGPEHVEEMRQRMLANKLIPRYATAEEVAGLCAYLLSDEAAYATGAPYLIDGGQIARS